MVLPLKTLIILSYSMVYQGLPRLKTYGAGGPRPGAHIREPGRAPVPASCVEGKLSMG